MTDEMTLARAKKGDPAAFEALVTPYERMVWGVCFQMMGSREDSEDAAQEALIRAWRGIASCRGDAAFSTWLYRIAVNTCLDALRKRKSRPAESLEALGDHGFDPVDTAALPEEEAVRTDERARLRAALSQLPEEQRVPLILYAVEDQPYETVAAILSLPVGTVKSRISRARQRLKEILSESGNQGRSLPSNQAKGGRQS